MKITLVRRLLPLLLGAALLPTLSHAQGGGGAKHKKAATSKAAPKNDAKRHLDAGTKAFRAGDYARARPELEKAQKASPQPATLRMLAECNFKLGDVGAAHDQYAQLANEGSAPQKAEAQRMLTMIDALMAQIEITGAAPGAEVFVDDRALGETPVREPVRVAAGTHKVRATMEGTEVFHTDVTVKAQDKVTVPLKFLPDGEEAAAKPASDDAPQGEAAATSDEGDAKSEEAPAEAPVKGGKSGLYASVAAFGAVPVVGKLKFTAPPDGGASSSPQLGGGLALHGGYAFGTLAIEASLAFLGDRHTEMVAIPGSANPDSQAYQDGDIARTESYLIYSLGGFAGVGPRFTTGGESVRFTVGASPGVSMRKFSLERKVSGGLDDYKTSVTATHFALMADASVLIGKKPGLQVEVGVLAFVDVASQTETPSGDPRIVTVPNGDTTVDVHIPTPAYAVQKGTQIYVGPQIGIRFGQ